MNLSFKTSNPSTCKLVNLSTSKLVYSATGRLYQFNLLHFLLFVAVMTFKNTMFLVDNMEDSVHRFIISDTLWVIASYNAPKLIRCHNLLLLYHFIVINDVQHHVRCHDRQTRNFIIGKELIAHLDDSLCAYHLR